MKRPAAAIRLVVNADDLGVSERVNAGIILAHRRGIVTAASLMAVGRAFAQAVEGCRAFPALDVGVHLTLVAEPPLRPNSSLPGPDGRLPASAGAFLRRWAAGGIRRDDIRAECAAQIERVLNQGLRVTHLDSHQHVHALPRLADLCLDLAARYGIPFVRVPVEQPVMEVRP
ncbi:MAG: ChbG/HpnK family deacetylase, partial [Desulfobacteraceae bacterium]